MERKPKTKRPVLERCTCAPADLDLEMRFDPACPVHGVVDRFRYATMLLISCGAYAQAIEESGVVFPSSAGDPARCLRDIAAEGYRLRQELDEARAALTTGRDVD